MPPRLHPHLDWGKELLEGLLPHRGPALRVDRLLAWDATKPALLASVTVSPADPLLAGHFPGGPIWPGVATIEALAQAAGLLWALHAAGPPKARSAGAQGGPGTVFLTATHIKLTAPVRPNDTVMLTAWNLRSVGALARVDVEATVAETVVATGRLTLAAELT